ncbi:glycosyltransferase family A protein [Cellulosimicrobium marinum]|uniref:glycosyltransferase family A protein n=1 Tax=Cellulosimicrobium marinum TaxID=1638992 RepID=UPI001E604603|nr:glycosyltransferase family A protein [Cellulosimicrobium marinum]MCB7137202.1 glycosyltransferase family 2 protein [Cellulosimicrobium marinum]
MTTDAAPTGWHVDPRVAADAAHGFLDRGADDGVARAVRAALLTQSPAVREVLARMVDPRDGYAAVLARARRAAATGDHARTAPPTLAGGRALCGLARVVGLQNHGASDVADAVDLYAAARRVLPLTEWTRRDLLASAQLLWAAGRRTELRADQELLARVPRHDRTFLEIDLLGHERGVGSQDWLRALNAALVSSGADPVRLRDTGPTPFDRLSPTAPGGGVSGPLVSVVVAAFRPGFELLAAVRSIADQTWGDLEILLVDDASGPEFAAVFGEALAIDERVRLLTQPVNRGTYAARNRAMAEARGEFITFHDADDWAHPARLERQVVPLRDDPGLLRTLSTSIRCSSALEFQYLGFSTTRSNASSHLFRRSVLDEVGGFDWVRKSADSEFDRRLEAWRPGRRLQLAEQLAFVRLEPDSLSRGDFRPGWMHPGRTEYRASMLAWHQQIVRGASPRMSATPHRRPLTAPRPFLRGAVEPRRVDIAMLADWSGNTSAHRHGIAEAEALARAGVSVGLVDVPTLRPHGPVRRPTARAVRRLVASGAVTMLSLEENDHVPTVVVRQPEVLQFPSARPVGLTTDRVVMVADGAARADGTLGWSVADCDRTASRLFGVTPCWWPVSPAARAEVVQDGAAPDVSEARYPRVLSVPDVVERRDRAGRDGHRLVVGWVSEEEDGTIPSGRRLHEVFPADDALDVRLLGPRDVLRHELGHVPPQWAVFDASELTAREFFRSLDVVLCFPDAAGTVEAERTVVEAMLHGCVAVLDPRLEDDFGDAALYCPSADVREVVLRLGADAGLYRTLRRRSRDLAVRRSTGTAGDLLEGYR